MWEPSETDRQWLQTLMSTLTDGGIWAAPMGFVYRKEIEELPYGLMQPTLRLLSIRADNLDAWILLSNTIERCALIGKQIGVEVETQAKEIIADLSR